MFHNSLKQQIAMTLPLAKIFRMLFNRRLVIAIPASLFILLLLPLSAFAQGPSLAPPLFICTEGGNQILCRPLTGDFQEEGPSSFDVSTGIADQLLEKGCTKLGNEGELVELACVGTVFVIKANEVHLFNGPTFHPSEPFFGGSQQNPGSGESTQQPIPTDQVRFAGGGQQNPVLGENNTQPSSPSGGTAE